MTARLLPALLVFIGAAIRILASDTGIPVDRVWSGHPVTFAFLTERGHQFIAYYDAERRITVAGRRLDETQWTFVRPSGVPVPGRKRDSNLTEWDSHNYLALALDRDGHLHLSGNLHNDPLVYYRTRKPRDLSTLERIDRMTGDRETRCTYPVFFNNAVGDLLFRYRDGGSGNGVDCYNIYDPATRTWRHLLDTPLLDGEGRRNAYALNPILGPDGRFHLVWMWRDTPDAATNHTLSYARSRDFIHWETSDGRPLPLPLTLASGEVIDPAPPRTGLINMTFNLGFDPEHHPVVVYHRYDAQGRSQAFAARPAAGSARWDIRQLSDWDFRWAFGGDGSLAADVELGAPGPIGDGVLRVDFRTRATGPRRWLLDAGTLAIRSTSPPPAPVLPVELQTPRSRTPGMTVQTVESRHAGRRWVLRWETLPRNRDRPRREAPPPTELRVYEFPDTDTFSAGRVGS